MSRLRQTNATGVVSAINFEYRGFDTVGEEFILFIAAAGVAWCCAACAASGSGRAIDEAAGPGRAAHQRARSGWRPCCSPAPSC